MPPEDLAADTNAVTVDAPTIAAPRREKRLSPVAVQRRPAAAVRVPTATPRNQAVPISALESKAAALRDPQELLNLMRTEATLRRAQRLSGAGDAQRQTMRLLSVGMLFALLAAALGAMWYLQTSVQASHRGHRPAAAASAPVPGVGTR